MIFMPPRHGKSFIASERFPTWVIGKCPEIEVKCCSYGAELANDFSRHALDLVESDYYMQVFPRTKLSKRRKKLSHWETKKGGGYGSTGIGGALTGKGAHILVIDDPFKDWKVALSENAREDCWNWYQSTAYTRLAPGGGVLVIQTRWHYDDLSGRLLEKQKEKGADQWEILSFPAIADKPEKHRKVGEALHPERFSLDALNNIKANQAHKIWISLYQQKPAEEEGNEFKRADFRYYESPPEITRIIISVDATFKDAETCDNVSVTVWGDAFPDFYMLENITKQAGFTETCAIIDKLYKDYPGAVLLIEEEANGAAIIETMTRKYPGVIAVHPIGGKVARARAMAHVVEGHNLFVPKWVRWVPDYIDEMCAFPFGKNDDQVDSTTQAVNYMLGKEEILGIEIHPQKTYSRR